MERENHDPLRDRLAPFLERNPESRYSRDVSGCTIAKPWADESLKLVVPTDADKLIEAMNAIYLPPRFTALWHSDTKDLEIIWTSLPVPPEFRERSFTFLFRGRTYRCEYGDASDRLILLSRFTRAVRPPGETGHRNMQSFWLFQAPEMAFQAGTGGMLPEPTSFWIRNVDWDENAMVELAANLNFFMYYFDRKTPRILIHERPPEKEEVAVPVRFPFDSFPPEISGRPIQRYLLGLWESSIVASDLFRRFVYSYQIVEYAAFYHIKRTALEKIRRVLLLPDLSCRPGRAANEILDAVVDHGMTEDQRFEAIIRDLVDPALVWSEIEPNLPQFCSEVVFDGGLRLVPLARPEWSVEDFSTAGMPLFIGAIRKLRNGLVHARERRTSTFIAPTRANYEKLTPWLAPLQSAAMEVALYCEC